MLRFSPYPKKVVTIDNDHEYKQVYEYWLSYFLHKNKESLSFLQIHHAQKSCILKIKQTIK